MCSGEEFNVKYDENSAGELNSGQYLVERVVGKRFFRGELHYRIKWKGYPDEENTWEPLRNCSGALSLIREFEEKIRQKCSKSVCSVGVGRKLKCGDDNREAVSRRNINYGESSKRFTDPTIASENVTNQNTVQLDEQIVRCESSNNNPSEGLSDHKSGKKRRLKKRGDLNKPTAALTRSPDCDNENLSEPSTRWKSSSNDLDTTLTSQISVKRPVNKDTMVCTVAPDGNSEDKSRVRKFSASEIEIVGAEPSKEGVIIGVKAKNEQEVIRLYSKEVTDLWPQLYVSFLEQHIVFDDK